jgi:ADP-ribose pyrophosphatase
MENIEKWQLLNSQEAFKTPWFNISKNNYHINSLNKDQEYFVLNEQSGANIVALTADNKVLLVKQYRPALDKVVYDFPAGYIEKGEDKMAAASRELLEETGYSSSNWLFTGEVNPLPNRISKTDYCFLAQNIELTQPQKLDEFEQISFQLFSIEELERMILNNEFNCGVCLSSWLRTKIHLKNV